MEELHEHGEAEHLDEGDGLRVRTQSRDKGTRPHRVLGQQDHLL